MCVQILSSGVDAARDDLDTTGVLPSAVGKKGIACDYELGAAQARNTAARLLLRPLKPTICRRCRAKEESIVEVVHIETTRRVEGGKRIEQPKAVHQQQIVCAVSTSNCA